MKIKKAFGIIGIIMLIMLIIIVIPTNPKNKIIDKNYIYNELGILSPGTIEIIDDVNTSLAKKIKGAEIRIFTVNLNGQSGTSEASRFFKKAISDGLNDDNGMILFIGKDEVSKKIYVEIRVGSELEKTLPTKRTSELIKEKITPFIKDNDFDNAVVSGIKELSSIVKKEYGSYYEKDLIKNNSIKVIIKFIIIIGVTTGLLSIIFLGLHFTTANKFYKDTLIEIWSTIIDIFKNLKDKT